MLRQLVLTSACVKAELNPIKFLVFNSIYQKKYLSQRGEKCRSHPFISGYVLYLQPLKGSVKGKILDSKINPKLSWSL